MVLQVCGPQQSIQRDPQKYAWEDAFELAALIGRQVIPRFTIDDKNRFAYQQVAKWMVGDPEMLCNAYEGNGEQPGDLTKGLYIQGPTGTGKSVLLNIFRRVGKALNIQITAYDPGVKLIWEMRSADAICAEYERDGDLAVYKREKILCINDLGTEPAEVLYMGNRRGCLRTILESRGDAYDKVTLISSNIPINKTGDFYGERVQSRLYKMCNPITMCGDDRRKK